MRPAVLGSFDWSSDQDAAALRASRGRQLRAPRRTCEAAPPRTAAFRSSRSMAASRRRVRPCEPLIAARLLRQGSRDRRRHRRLDAEEAVRQGNPLGDLRRDHLPVLVPAVPGAAADRAPDPALVRRQRGGVDHLHAVLPGAAARRLRLRALPECGCAEPARAGDPQRAAASPRVAHAADRAERGVEAARATRSRSAASCCCSARRVGLPYFLLASTSPLLQAWFVARAARRESLPPVRGVEPRLAGRAGRLSVRASSRSSAAREQVSALVVAVRRLRAALRGGGVAHAAQRHRRGQRRRKRRRGAAALIVLWLALSATGSVLLLAVTNHLTQNVAAVPLLWLAPLTLYLLSFIITFEGARLVPARVPVDRWCSAWLGGMGWLLVDDRATSFDLRRAARHVPARACSSAAFSATASSTGCGRRRSTSPAFYLSGLRRRRARRPAGGGGGAARLQRLLRARHRRWSALALLAALRFATLDRVRALRRASRVLLGVAARAAYDGFRYQRGRARRRRAASTACCASRSTARRATETHLRRLVHGAIMHGEQYLHDELPAHAHHLLPGDLGHRRARSRRISDRADRASASSAWAPARSPPTAGRATCSASTTSTRA